MTDDLTLITGGRKLSGWTEIRVTRGCERIPSDFEIAMTERYPDELQAAVVRPGDTCEVRLGGDLVISGYVDRYVPSVRANQHSVRAVGRGRCQDLVDCSAEWPSNQIGNASARGLVERLAKPYGIKVTGEEGPITPQFNLMWGETPVEVIDRVCRHAGLLAYERADGGLHLARVGSARAASGFTLGVNVEAAQIAYSMDERFSEYVVRQLSMSALGDLGNGGDILARIPDEGVAAQKRHRLKYIIVDTGQAGTDIATKRGVWERNRRYGRSAQLTLVTDSWRDSAGKLWEPNTLVPLSLPSLRIEKKSWVISEVTYQRDATSGTTAALTIMPPEAFQPEPIVLQPLFPGLVGAGTP